MPANMYSSCDLKVMQGYSFERKIQIAQRRIMEWHHHWDGAISVSTSGGKDSTVLYDLARRIYPDIEAVFVDTQLEFPELKAFALSIPNVTVLKPAMRFDEIIKTYGWCYPSKDNPKQTIIPMYRKGAPKIRELFIKTSE